MAKLNRVLYVEDDEDIRKIASLVFEMDKLDVAICASAAEALNEIETAMPDLAVIDVMMPGMDGIELFGQFRNKKYPFPVIFMTAKTQRDEIAAYFELGVIGVISKPFDPENLVAEIKQYFVQYQEKPKY